MLSPTATSTFSAAALIDSEVIAPLIRGSTSWNRVQPPTNPATAEMSIVELPYAALAFASSA
jgi:hypothetical protein